MDPPQHELACREKSPSDDEELISKIDRDKDSRVAFLQDAEKVNSDVESFKQVSEYVPATEIDASLDTHVFEKYELKVVDIVRPDFSKIQHSFRHLKHTQDPRLKMLLGLHDDCVTSTSEIEMQHILKVDPRLEEHEQASPIQQQISAILRNSFHYNELGPLHKKAVNEVLDELLQQLKLFHEDPSPDKFFDSEFVAQRPKLQQILYGLNIFVNAKGEFEQVVQLMPIVDQLPPLVFLDPQYEMPLVRYDPKDVAYEDAACMNIPTTDQDTDQW